MEYQIIPNILCLLHCVPLYVCRLCINYQDLSTNILGVAALRMLLLTFTSHFMIDFLSIRKVIIFSAIATDDHHPLHGHVKLHDDSFPLYSVEKPAVQNSTFYSQNRMYVCSCIPFAYILPQTSSYFYCIYLNNQALL